MPAHPYLYLVCLSSVYATWGHVDGEFHNGCHGIDKLIAKFLYIFVNDGIDALLRLQLSYAPRSDSRYTRWFNHFKSSYIVVNGN